ncbi:ABC transporter substrate-binding protein [Azospirillum sp. RWY-5-1]|uniref:ABC transporter substrate-binding protein n=1 Tax=Azospirillum oleiclasticum TaxID=2735135 RepID=A0ABX2TIQ5_9PROT|nr:ABC transporter substrate-binding protein [Azospirillum oleiclasticum]NYZ16073.1 ABC transporter substrate-binding protein [Azospirillum oleiclasticum]NYZ22954.1 ABC transporter substrate-binding protein [Azospirillum oleiclasticum]
MPIRSFPARRLALALLVAAGGALSTPALAEKSLVFCSEGNPESFNPQVTTTGTSMNAALPLYNNLVEFVRGTTRTKAGLAESWTVSEDGLTYLFTLRPDVWFHANEHFTPTRPMNADDVVFSIERQWRADHPFHKVGRGTYDYFKDMSMAVLLKAVERVDDRTVRIVLTRPEAPFLANLAMPFASIQSAEYAKVLAERGRPELFDEAPVGTGPFRFVSFQKDVAIRYRAHDRYWGGRERLDALIFSINPNAAVRLNKLRAGECHLMVFPNPAELAKIEKDPDLVVQRREGLNIAYLAFNTSRPPFDDLRVRRALNLAVDKETLIEAVYQGAARPAKNPIPPIMWSYDESTPGYPFDPEGARRLLAEAGYPDGFTAELWFPPVARQYMPNGKRAAEIIRDSLERVGVRVTLRTDDWREYRRRLGQGEHDMAIYGWTGDNGDPDNFLFLLLGCDAARPGGGNIARWCDPGFEEQVTRAKRTPVTEERADRYREAQRIFAREAPWVPLAHSVVSVVLRREVRGYRIDPFLQVFSGVDIDTP